MSNVLKKCFQGTFPRSAINSKLRSSPRPTYISLFLPLGVQSGKQTFLQIFPESSSKVQQQILIVRQLIKLSSLVISYEMTRNNKKPFLQHVIQACTLTQNYCYEITFTRDIKMAIIFMSQMKIILLDNLSLTRSISMFKTMNIAWSFTRLTLISLH